MKAIPATGGPLRGGLTSFVFLLAMIGETQAQDAAVAQHMSAANARAGSQWTAAVDFLCAEEPDVGGRDQAAMIEPVQLFDNLYAIGRISTVVYALTTSEGIILIDSGYEGQEESVLMPGLAELANDLITPEFYHTPRLLPRPLSKNQPRYWFWQSLRWVTR